MADDERALEGWESAPGDIIVGEYDNGAILYPACPDCGRPGDVWAMYHGQRWKIEPRAEIDACPPSLRGLPPWALWLILLTLVLSLFNAVALVGAHDLDGSLLDVLFVVLPLMGVGLGVAYCRWQRN